jgi:hypothetical protein
MSMIDPAALKPLSAAILSDVMDSLGLMRQAMKPRAHRPVHAGL